MFELGNWEKFDKKVCGHTIGMKIQIAPTRHVVIEFL